MSIAPLRGGSARENELLTATMEVLRETGYGRLTVDAVVARARASKTTVYRRWPSKSALVVAAFSHAVRGLPTQPDTGSLREDLVSVLDPMVNELNRLGDVMAGLVGELRRDPDLAEAMRSDFIAVRKRTMMRVFAQAQARGELARTADLERIWYLAPGLVFFRAIMLGEKVDHAFVRDLVDHVVMPVIRAAG